MADEIFARPDAVAASERGVAAVSTIGGFAALFSAAACCVLPLVFTALGLGAGGLAAIVPYHWPLTIFAAFALGAGWLLYWRRRRTYADNANCGTTGQKRTTLILLSAATIFVGLSAAWPTYLEQPLMRLLGDP